MLVPALLLLVAPATPQAPETLLDRSWRLEALDLEVRELRWLDAEAGTIRRAAWLPDGRPVDLDALRYEDARRRRAARQGMSPELATRVAATPPGEPLHVVFWLRAEGAPDFRRILEDAEAAGAGPEDARRLARDAAADFHDPGNRAFAERLAAAGLEVTQVAGPWPLVFARVPAGQVADWSLDPAVDLAYFVFPEWYPELDNAQATMRTLSVWDRGNTGAGSTVKVMVNDVGDVSSSNPYLPPRTYLTTIGLSSHATAVAGNIAMTHSTLRGAAHGLPEIYSAGGAGDSAAPNVWNLAISAGVSFGNCSWWNGNKGQIVFLDRFFDHTIRNFGVMMFKSTGNQGNSSSPYTTTPGNGYNMTNSGAYSDGDTWSWSDDAMASYSSYWDPVEGHEKPELANAGDDVDTAGTSSPWIYYGFNGTSSASPLTCGVATLLASRDPSLKSRPESIKAILMVSAWHNIEGSAVLSEKDGAGAVHAAAADAVVRDGQFVNGTLTASSFTNNQYDVPFTAWAGDETRVIALWFSNADASYSTDVLDMDVDLLVIAPNGATVASSASAFNPFEIAAFVPPVTGTYTLRLVKNRFNGVSEPFCVAWSSRQDMAVAEVGLLGSPRIGSTVTATFRDRYHPGAFYQAHVSGGTLPDAVSLGNGWILPLQGDGTFAKSAGWTGFAGTLDASGNASAALTIPNRPAMVGRTFYAAMYPKPNAGSATIHTTSEAFAATVLP